MVSMGETFPIMEKGITKIREQGKKKKENEKGKENNI